MGIADDWSYFPLSCFASSQLFGCLDQRLQSGLKVKAARISPAEVSYAKAAAEKAGLRLVGMQKAPDGTVRLEFGEFADNDDWRAGTRYERRA